MKKNFSIRTYLGLSHALLLVISLGSISFIWSQNEYKVITQELEKMTRERITLISTIISLEISEHGGVPVKNNEFQIVDKEKNLLAVYADKSGAVYEVSPGMLDPYQKDLMLKLMSEHPVYKKSYSTVALLENNATGIYAAAPVFNAQNESIGTVCMLLPVVELDAYLLRLRWILLLAVLFVALLGVGVSTLLTNYFSHQFSNAQKLAAMVSEGSYHLRIPEAGPTELRDLAHYLNVMAEELQDQTKTRQTLLSNVAHELARPLGGLQLGIESLRKGAIRDPELADDLLVSMGETIQGLECLIDDVTLAAQPKSLPIEVFPAALSVEPFLQGVATRFWSQARSRGLRLEVCVPPGLPPVYADEKRLNQIIGNLVDNAIKFTPRDKSIRLFAECADENNVRLIVHDGGKGISPGEAEHLFEPFYQGNIGRRIKQGMGLGLSISLKLAEAQNGSLTLENHPQGGAVAILTLPAASA